MTHLHNDRTSRKRRRASATLVLATATGGLLAAAMAGSPTARADDLTDISNDVQASITAGEADYSAAGTDFSTAGDTNEGLIALVAGFDNTFLSPADYILVGLTGEATGTNISGIAGDFLVPDTAPVTAAGETALAATQVTDGDANLAEAATLLSSGEYASAALYATYGAYQAFIDAPQADLLAALFTAGL
jgi:hypothetical protein